MLGGVPVRGAAGARFLPPKVEDRRACTGRCPRSSNRCAPPRCPSGRSTASCLGGKMRRLVSGAARGERLRPRRACKLLRRRSRVHRGGLSLPMFHGGGSSNRATRPFQTSGAAQHQREAEEHPRQKGGAELEEAWGEKKFSSAWRGHAADSWRRQAQGLTTSLYLASWGAATPVFVAAPGQLLRPPRRSRACSGGALGCT